MPDKPYILPRDELAKFLPNQRAIKAFERMAKDVGVDIPQSVKETADAVQTATRLAEEARQSAQLAQEAADRAAEQAQAIAQDPQMSSIREELAALARIVKGLQQS